MQSTEDTSILTPTQDMKGWLALGAAQSELKEMFADTSTIPYVVIPKDYQLHTMEELVERYANKPAHLKQAVKLQNPASFANYLKRHGTESVAVFCVPEKHIFTAYLDWHIGIDQRHCFHTATLNLEITRELGTWLNNNGREMDQVEFASFIEANAPEIISAEDEFGSKTPSGSEMLQIALTLSRTENAAFRSATRLQNGQTQFKYEQNFDDKAGENGELTIPQMIKIGLPLFKAASADEGYIISARFRYRIRQGRLVMWYELIRPERIIDDAMQAIEAKLRTELDGPTFAFYSGTAN